MKAKSKAHTLKITQNRIGRTIQNFDSFRQKKNGSIFLTKH